MGENPRGPTGPWPSRPTRLPPWPTYPTTPNPNPLAPHDPLLLPHRDGSGSAPIPSPPTPCGYPSPSTIARGLRRRRLLAHSLGAYLTGTTPPASSSSSSTRCRGPSSPPQRHRPASSSSPAAASRRLRPRHRSSRPRAPAPPRAHF